MDKFTFLCKLFAVFPPEKNLDDVLDFYSEALASDKEYNYKKLLSIVAKEYTFKTPPPVSWLLKKREMCEKPKLTELSGREGEIVKRTFRGIEYEFVIVPSSWSNVKTISQIDKEIAEWNKRNSNLEQQSLYE